MDAFFSKKLRGWLSTLVLALCICSCRNARMATSPLPPSTIADLAAKARPASEYGIRFDSGGHALKRRPLYADAEDMRIELPTISDRLDRIGHTLVKLDINGRKCLALVDTGSPYSIVSHRLARAADIVPILDTGSRGGGSSGLHMIPLRGLGGHATQIAAVAPRIALAGEEIEDVPVMIVNIERGLGSVERIGDKRVEMILGNDFLSLFGRVVFDFEKEVVILDNSDPDRRASGPDSVALFRTRPIPIAIGSIADNAPVPVAIDTGSDSGLWVPAGMSRRLELLDYNIGPQQSYGRGFGGKTVYRNIAPHALGFDNITIRNIPVTVELVPQTAKGPGFVLLGQRALRRFRVTIDYRESRMMLERID